MSLQCTLCEHRIAVHNPICFKCNNLLPHISLNSKDQKICRTCLQSLTNTFKACKYHANSKYYSNCSICPRCPMNPCQKCYQDTCVTNNQKCMDCSLLLCSSCIVIQKGKARCQNCMEKFCHVCFKVKKMRRCICEEDHKLCHQCYIQFHHNKCGIFVDKDMHDTICKNTIIWKDKGYGVSCIIKYMENQEKKILEHNKNRYLKKIIDYPITIQEMILNMIYISSEIIMDT